MNHPSTPPSKQNKPATLIIAAIVLILFSGVGIAALMGWLPSASQAGRPGQLMTPPADQLATAAVNSPTATTQSSQYTAGAGTINNQAVTSGTSGGGSTGGSGVVAAPVLPNSDPRVPAPARDGALQAERTRESGEARATARKEAAKPVCANCGIVESVNGQTLPAPVNTSPDGTVATAAVANKVTERPEGSKRYQVSVRMHDGQIRTVQTDQTVWRAGDQVKIEDGRLLVR